MPIYVYKCDKCNHNFEKLLSISNRKLPETEPCPECKDENCVVQCLSTANFSVDLHQPKTGRFAKPNSDWVSFLKQVKKNNKGSDFNTYG